MAELRDGILAGLNFTPTERKAACDAVSFVTIDDLCGAEFIRDGLAPLLKPDEFDLLLVDPLLSYIGGDVSRQEVVSPFLRNQLNPVLHRAGVGCVLVHHTNKPATGQAKPDWAAGDFAYLGSGSAELANWARAVVAIRSLGVPDVFELRLGKRGSRVGWHNPDGTPAYSRLIAHGRDGIYWREADTSEAPDGPGRKRTATPAQLAELLNGEGRSTTAWRKLADDELGLSKSVFYRLKDACITARLVAKSKVNGAWFKA